MTTLSSCMQTSIETKVEKALSDLTDKFTQLPKGKSNQTDFYVHIRTVERNGFQIQLWSTPEYIEDQQKIVVFINPNGLYSAIPFFSNTYRDYWDFEFDQPIPNLKRVNTTFDTELRNTYKLLNLKEASTTETTETVINELFISVLQCKCIERSDSVIFKSQLMTTTNDLPMEDLDSCFKRKELNKNDILSKIGLNKTGNYNSAYFDESNGRIYLIQYDLKQRELNFSIKVYRQDCVVPLFSM